MKPSSIAYIPAILVAGLVYFGGEASGQEFSTGSCPPFPVVTQFDLAKYLGTWYDFANYFAIFQALGECTYAEYSDATPPEGPPKIRVINRNINKLTGELIEAKGYAVLNDPTDPDVPAQLIVNFESTPPEAMSTSTNYNVVDTDYTSYAIVYNCNELPGDRKAELMWVLTREQEPPKSLTDKVYAKIEYLGLDTGRLKPIKQNDCPKF